MMVVHRPDRPGGTDDLPDASRRAVGERRQRHADRRARRRAARRSCSTATARYELLEGDGLDPEIVDALAPQGVTYTPYADEAIAAVDRGEAEAAFLLRPTPHRGRLGDRRAAAT